MFNTTSVTALKHECQPILTCGDDVLKKKEKEKNHSEWNARVRSVP